MQLVDSYFHGSLIHFGVHGWTAGELGGLGCQPGLLARCSGLDSGRPTLGLEGGSNAAERT